MSAARKSWGDRSHCGGGGGLGLVRLENMTTVTYLGPAGTFTEAALLDIAAHGGVLSGGPEALEAVPMVSPAAALAAVRHGEAEFACVAVENSVDGPVTPTFDALTAGPELQIYQETEIDVVFSILVRAGTEISDIKTFSTHAVAHPQVRQWLDQNLPGVEVFYASSNGAAAEKVAAGEVDACAAPARAGELNGLVPVAEEVADVRGARTRFILVGKPGPLPPRTGTDRTSVSFTTVPNKAGSLMEAMNEFAVRGVNLTRIESRPTRTAMGTYRFHIDVLGHLSDPPVSEALAALHRRAEGVRFLGSWPSYSSSPLDTPPPDVTESIDWVAGLLEGKR